MLPSIRLQRLLSDLFRFLHQQAAHPRRPLPPWPRQQQWQPLPPLERPRAAASEESSSLQQALQRLAPQLKILPPPRQERAAAAILLSYADSAPLQQLEKNLCRAIAASLCPATWAAAATIANSGWRRFLQQTRARWLLIEEQALRQDAALQPFYRPFPQPRLGDIPLLLLPPLQQYLDAPQQRKALWKRLCATLQSPL